MNRQGNDVGTSYRSEIFYVSEAQRDEALRTVDDLNASGLWPGRVVTKVSPVVRKYSVRFKNYNLARARDHWNVTKHPTAPWVVQQFRTCVTGEGTHRFIVHDRDSIYSERVDLALRAMRLRVLKTPLAVPQAMVIANT